LFLRSPDNPQDIIGAISGKLELQGDHADGHIYTLAVDSKCRGQGLGRKLVTAFEHEMVQAAHRADVELVSLSLESKCLDKIARLFYENLGFRCTLERKGYYNGYIDSVVMEKRWK
jgi:ribosomal protein S18 acetylase RimI-like enzyme